MQDALTNGPQVRIKAKEGVHSICMYVCGRGMGSVGRERERKLAQSTLTVPVFTIPFGCFRERCFLPPGRFPALPRTEAWSPLTGVCAFSDDGSTADCELLGVR